MNDKITTTDLIPGVSTEIFDICLKVRAWRNGDDECVYTHCSSCAAITELSDLYGDDSYTGKVCRKCYKEIEAESADRWADIDASDRADYRDYRNS